MYKYAEVVEEPEDNDYTETSSFSYPGHPYRPVTSVFRRNSGFSSGHSKPALPPRILPLLYQQKKVGSVSSNESIKSLGDAKCTGEGSKSYFNVRGDSISSTPLYQQRSQVLKNEGVVQKRGGDGDLDETSHTVSEMTYPPYTSKNWSYSDNIPLKLFLGTDGPSHDQETPLKEREPSQLDPSEMRKLEIKQDTLLIEVARSAASPSERDENNCQNVNKPTIITPDTGNINAGKGNKVESAKVHAKFAQTALIKRNSINRTATPYRSEENLISAATPVSRTLVAENNGIGSRSIFKSRNNPHYYNQSAPMTHCSEYTPYKQELLGKNPLSVLSSTTNSQKTVLQNVASHTPRDIFSKKLTLASDNCHKPHVVDSCVSDKKSKPIGQNKENDSIPHILERPIKEASIDKEPLCSRFPLKDTLSEANKGIPSDSKIQIKKTLFIEPDVNEVRGVSAKEPQEDVPLKNTAKQECVSVSPNSLSELKTNSLLSVKGKDYYVLSGLGVGGSSQVYQVLEPKRNILLAVKRVNLSNTDPATAEGYLNEIALLSKLQDSSRVIKLFDHEYVKQQQALYVVMEKGDIDLSSLLKKMWKSKETITIPMIIYYWTEMLSAVKDIHDYGVVHSDLKPANFLLVAGRLKLIDFGIASSVQNDMTSINKNGMVGTYNYMSPEAIQDPRDKTKTRVGYKSDVWSLGCILYSMMYGKTPFQHVSNSFAKLQLITNPDHKISYPPVDKCPPALMEAVKGCLTYNSKLRPSVMDLLNLPYISYPRKVNGSN